MTNEEKLKAIYQDKIDNGLVDVKYDIDWSKNPSRDELISEVLAMEEAILSGATEVLSFGDSNWIPTT